MTALLYAVFFVSGTSALIFETLWFRQAGLALGNSVWASSLVLSGFMGGLALGNAAAARYGGLVRNAVRAYAIAEVAIAITGVALVYALPVLGAALAPLLRPLLDHPWALNPIRLTLAFVLLLIPSTAMGITLPLLTSTVVRDERPFGTALGQLYGWNTLGAVVGVVAGEMYLVGALGVRGTALVAGTLNLVAAAVALWLSKRAVSSFPAHWNADAGRAFTARLADRKGPRRRGVRRGGPSGSPAVSGSGTRWLAAAFLSGFCLLALEVVWFRFLLLFVKGHSLALALMLGIILTGIALGGLAAASWLRYAAGTPPLRFGDRRLPRVSRASFRMRRSLASSNPCLAHRRHVARSCRSGAAAVSCVLSFGNPLHVARRRLAEPSDLRSPKPRES